MSYFTQWFVLSVGILSLVVLASLALEGLKLLYKALRCGGRLLVATYEWVECGEWVPDYSWQVLEDSNGAQDTTWWTWVFMLALVTLPASMLIIFIGIFVRLAINGRKRCRCRKVCTLEKS